VPQSDPQPRRRAAPSLTKPTDVRHAGAAERPAPRVELLRWEGRTLPGRTEESSGLLAPTTSRPAGHEAQNGDAGEGHRHGHRLG
jgi:hypothetical protein